MERVREHGKERMEKNEIYRANINSSFKEYC